jgi:hypothetical protein
MLLLVEGAGGLGHGACCAACGGAASGQGTRGRTVAAWPSDGGPYDRAQEGVHPLRGGCGAPAGRGRGPQGGGTSGAAVAGNEGEDGVHGGSPREKGRKVRETIKRARIRKRMTCQCRGRRGEPQNGDGFRRGRWRWPETLTEVSPEKFVVQTSALGLRGYEWRIQMWFSDLERAWLHRDIYSQIRKNGVIFIILEIPEIHF